VACPLGPTTPSLRGVAVARPGHGAALGTPPSARHGRPWRAVPQPCTCTPPPPPARPLPSSATVAPVLTQSPSAWCGPRAAWHQHGAASAHAVVVPLRDAAPCPWLGPGAASSAPLRMRRARLHLDEPVYPLDAPSTPSCILCVLNVLFILCS
jgi:hypothetical protein